MKKIIVFGATGGLGKQLIPFLETKYQVTSLGSKDLDVTSFEKTKEFFDNIDYDIILNMSGVKYDQFLSKITSEDIIEINKMIDVNVKGNINIISSALPKLIEKKYGRIISISSVFAELSVPKNSIYCASKALPKICE